MTLDLVLCAVSLIAMGGLALSHRAARSLRRRLDLSHTQNKRLQAQARAVMRGRSADDADRLDDEHGWTHVLSIGSRVEIEKANGDTTDVYEIGSWTQHPEAGSAVLYLERRDGSAS